LDPFLLAVLDQLVAHIGNNQLITILLNLTKAHLASIDQSSALPKSLVTFSFQLAALTDQVNKMSGTTDNLASEISALQGKVASLTDAEKAAEATMDGLAQLVKDGVAQAQAAGATPEQLAALTALGEQIDANKAALAAAVTRDTPQGVVASPAPASGGAGAPQSVEPTGTEPTGTDTPAPVVPPVT
jgi:hypothetical protein